jgi:hypothetical protein
LNRDGQLHQILTITYPQYAGKLVSVACNDGLPATAKWVYDSIIEKLESPPRSVSKPKSKKKGSRKKEDK